jgi:thioredoxin reductase
MTAWRPGSSRDSDGPAGDVEDAVDLNVAVLGAGPYGLAAAAHLEAAGLDVCVFGRPMSFWQEHMPAGMLLRSPFMASSISDPDNRRDLAAYHRDRTLPPAAPVPLERFIAYGRWFQERAAPHLDRRLVACVERRHPGFALRLDDGEVVRASRIVVAAGIEAFAHRPAPFLGLPPELVSHSSEDADLSRFEGRRVLVVGAGQSALETAALLCEAGADAELIVRRPAIRWLGEHEWLRQLGPVSRLLYAPHEVGPPILCRLVGAPTWFGRIPRPLQDRLHRRAFRPAGAGWLRSRVEGVVAVTVGRAAAAAVPTADGVDVVLDDGSTRNAGHVILGTGYRVDLRRYGFLRPALLEAVDQVGGYPVLGAGLECSVPGLHFLGAPAAWSYGPLMRFVAGTHFSARALTQQIATRTVAARS